MYIVHLYMYPDAWADQRRCARGLNPIDSGGYGSACSTRADKCIESAKPKIYICLSECVGFGNVDLSRGRRIAPTLPPSAVQISFILGSLEGSYGTTTWPARIRPQLMNIIT